MSLILSGETDSMIETDYHILPPDVFHEVKPEADQLGVSVDYYLMEFCEIEGDNVFLPSK